MRGTSARAAKQVLKVLAIRRLPASPPLEEALTLARKAPAMKTQQRVEARLVALPVVRTLQPQAVTEHAETLAGNVTVVGVAEDLLHLLHTRINLLAKGRRETVGKDLHRIAELLAEDADPVQVFVVVEVLTGGPVQLAAQVAEQDMTHVAQQFHGLFFRRLADGLECVLDQVAQTGPVRAPGLDQVHLGRIALAAGVADQEIEARLVLGGALLATLEEI